MSDFETWWQQEGQEFLYALNTTTDDDIKLVAEVAWKNGAYCAEQAEQEQEPVARVVGGVFEPFNDDVLSGAWELYAAPVRTKDLTDDEKWAIFTSKDWTGEPLNLIDTVITADREKNK